MCKAPPFPIEEMTPDHPEWQALVDVITQENHQLKLSMGFAVEPMEREEPSLAFIIPLRKGARNQ